MIPCDGTNTVGVRLINRDETDSFRGVEGRRKRVIVVPDEGRSPFEVELGLLYVHEHCARAFTPLNTQRQHTEIQNSENVRCVHVKESEREGGEREGGGGREERKSMGREIPERERERERERGRESRSWR